MIKLPGLIDPHVHVREPGATHKEDWDTATSAALAGGFTTILAMPNTKPPIFDAETLGFALDAARAKARCDYGQFLGAGPDNADVVAGLAGKSASLKMYLEHTFGQLRLDNIDLWIPHFQKWPGSNPLVLHAENSTVAAALLLSLIHDKPVHIAHVSLRQEILMIKAAKERGIKVTCEVTPHHLLLSKEDIAVIGKGYPGRGEVRPVLAEKEDALALWQNMDVVDCFATDHAPHTLQEKDSTTPPPGFPGLETALPLMYSAVRDGRLTLDQLIEKMVTNPRRLFHLPEQPDTWVEFDETAEYEIRAASHHSRCGWTPFEGYPVRGRVRRVVLRGADVFKDGRILAKPGSGRNVRTA